MLTTRRTMNFLFFCLTLLVVSVFAYQSIAGERRHRNNYKKYRSVGQPTASTSYRNSSANSVRRPGRGLRVVAGGGRVLRAWGRRSWVVTQPAARRPIDVVPLRRVSKFISVTMAQKTLAARRASVRYARSGPVKPSPRGFVVLTKTPTIDRDIQYWQDDADWQNIASERTAGEDEFDLRNEDDLPIIYFDD